MTLRLPSKLARRRTRHTEAQTMLADVREAIHASVKLPGTGTAVVVSKTIRTRKPDMIKNRTFVSHSLMEVHFGPEASAAQGATANQSGRTAPWTCATHVLLSRDRLGKQNVAHRQDQHEQLLLSCLPHSDP